MINSNECLLAVKGIHKHYGSVRALADVDLVVEAGQFVVLLGPNGAGKSTLIQLLTGLFTPDRGSIRICGIDLAGEPARALARLGVVFQEPTLDLELSVAANLRFHAGLHDLAGEEAARRIETALAFINLQDRARDRARQLSGGNRRRVELARALLHHPKLLLMDEATVGLDPTSRSEILNAVRLLASESGVGVLWATHLLDEAEKADKVILLIKGEKNFDGTVQALMQREGKDSPLDAFMAAIQA